MFFLMYPGIERERKNLFLTVLPHARVLSFATRKSTFLSSSSPLVLYILGIIWLFFFFAGFFLSSHSCMRCCVQYLHRLFLQKMREKPAFTFKLNILKNLHSS